MPRFGNEKKHFLQFMSHLKISLKKCDGWSLMNGVILLRLMLRDRSLKAKKREINDRAGSMSPFSR